MTTITDLGSAIYSSLAGALSLFFDFVPRLVGFFVILLIGWIVAKALEKGVALLLRRVGFDRVGDRIGLARMEQHLDMHMDAAGILGRIVFWFVFLIFLIPAFNALQLDAVSTLLSSLIGYIPNIFVAILVLLLGMLLATFAYDITVAAAATRMGNPRILGNIVRYSIIGFTVLVALQQLQIAPSLINILFTAVVGAAALALGLSFGLGGRDTARNLLSRSESAITGVTPGERGAGYGSALDQQTRFNQPPVVGKEQSAPSISPASSVGTIESTPQQSVSPMPRPSASPMPQPPRPPQSQRRQQ